MEYRISNSPWKCSLEAISKGDNPKIRHDDNQYGIIESLTVSCSMDNFRNIVYKTTKCQNSDLGNNRGKIVTNNNLNGSILIGTDFFNKQISAIAIAPALEITKSEAL